MKGIRNIAVILALSAIGIFTIYEYTRPRYEPNISDSLKIYVDEWKHDADSLGIDYEFRYKDIEYITAVTHYIDGDGLVGSTDRLNKRIYIKKDYGVNAVRSIVYHELGHYVFRLDHCNERGMIMSKNTMMEDDEYYGVNWQVLKRSYWQSVKNN